MVRWNSTHWKPFDISSNGIDSTRKRRSRRSPCSAMKVLDSKTIFGSMTNRFDWLRIDSTRTVSIPTSSFRWSTAIRARSKVSTICWSIWIDCRRATTTTNKSLMCKRWKSNWPSPPDPSQLLRSATTLVTQVLDRFLRFGEHWVILFYFILPKEKRNFSSRIYAKGNRWIIAERKVPPTVRWSHYASTDTRDALVFAKCVHHMRQKRAREREREKQRRKKSNARQLVIERRMMSMAVSSTPKHIPTIVDTFLLTTTPTPPNERRRITRHTFGSLIDSHQYQNWQLKYVVIFLRQVATNNNAADSEVDNQTMTSSLLILRVIREICWK